jgi:predicted PurR-regulated permease PerM
VVVAGLKAAATLLRPFLAALFLTALSLPLLTFFKKLRCSNAMAVVLTMLALILALTGLGTLVGGSINAFTNDLPAYQRALEDRLDVTLTWIQQRGVPVREWVSPEQIRPGSVLEMIGGTVRRLAAIVSSAFLVLITTLFLLAEVAGIPEKIRAAFRGHRDGVARIAKIREEVQRYLVIKTLVSIGTGALAGSLCALVGVDYPMLWALVAFLFNYIPTLGSILAGIPPVLLALVTLGFWQAFVILIGYVAINIGLGTVLEPHLLGRRLGLSTLVVFLSLVFWGWVWGPLGMLLSVPLTMIIKIMLENTEDLRWIAILLDAHPPSPLPEPDATHRSPVAAQPGEHAPPH